MPSTNPATERRSSRIRQRVSMANRRRDRAPFRGGAHRGEDTSEPAVPQNIFTPAVPQNNTGMEQKVNQLTKSVESLQKQLGEVTNILKTCNSSKGQDVNPQCCDIPQTMQLENSVSSRSEDSLAINSNVEGLLSRPHNSVLVGQTNTQNSALMGQTNTLMVDSSECSGIQIQVDATRGGYSTHRRTTSTEVARLNTTVCQLIDSSLAKSTKKMYIRIWNEFKNFCSSYLAIEDARIPISISTLSVFLASLFQKGLAAATLSTYNSAIGYVHKLNSVQDPTSSFLILKLLQGAKRSRVQVDTRLPITRSILHRMLVALPYICSSPFYQNLYRSMFLLAFYGFLRVGEMTRNLGQVDSHCLLISAVQFSADGLTISFISYKHSVPGKIVKLFVSKQVNQEMCPVVVLQRYLAVRGDYGGCLFVHPNGSPISRSQFTDILQKTLSFIGLSPSLYKGHSFRIGSCTWYMKQGKTDSQIRSMGRWRSNAFLKYIRPEISG